jgi:hypothetical protein
MKMPRLARTKATPLPRPLRSEKGGRPIIGGFKISFLLAPHGAVAPMRLCKRHARPPVHCAADCWRRVCLGRNVPQAATDGHVTSVLCSASAYRDAFGAILGVVAAARPVSSFAGESVHHGNDPRLRRAARLVLHLACALAFCIRASGLIGWGWEWFTLAAGDFHSTRVPPVAALDRLARVATGPHTPWHSLSA